MASSSTQIRPDRSLLLIGSTKDSAGIANPKPYGVKRYHNGETISNSLVKKARTTSPDTNTDPDDDKSIVVLDPTPLSIVEPPRPKLSRQFWKAGDDEEPGPGPRYCSNDAAVRVHPQFLHANATSHKWALGALAELLDNSLDEVCNGATYVHVDSMKNEKDKKSSILIVQDNGGGMDPNRFRECLSLGYSRKRNMANTVGQYGNGLKTSTMRLGADAIVFTRCRGTNGNNTTQSIGMLSYTFLYETRKCEAIVPTVDFELVDNNWKAITYNSPDEWFDNLETIVKWSPYSDQQKLYDEFDLLDEQGTRIVIYNLWEDDEGKLELDFDTDPHDIQLRGVNRDEKNIEMARTYPNSRRFLTYRHSLRSYVSILYLRLPKNFRIILRGTDVEHHSLLDDMMMTEDRVYRPMRSPECSPDEDVVAALKIGFVKDAHHHIDVQGFNVYHKNRLIKPFWRVWNAAGSDGRGVIGILEANFIQPAHNKQGFERTSVLSKIEARLTAYQKEYWSSRCHEIGYAQRRKQKNQRSSVTETTRQRTEVPPFNNLNHDRGASNSTPAPAQVRQNVDNTSGRNLNFVECVAGVKSVAGLTNGTSSVNLVAELQRQKAMLESQLKDEKAKKPTDELARVATELVRQKALVAELQRQKALLESQLTDSKAKIHDLGKSLNVVADLKRQKAFLESQLKNSKAKIQDLEKSLKAQDEMTKLVPELLKEKAQLELQLNNSKAKIHDLAKSLKAQDEVTKQRAQLELQLKNTKAKIQDLEKSQKARDEMTNLVPELQKQKAQLELQLKNSKAKTQDLEKSQKVQDELTKLVPELRKQRTLLESQLKNSKAKIQDLEKSQKAYDELTELVPELQEQRTLLELQLKDSKATIEDLETSQELTKLIPGLQRQKTQLELQLKQSNAKIVDLEKSHKGKDEMTKLVQGLQRQKAQLELQLNYSKDRIQDFEKSQKSVMDIFQEERTRRDLTEDDLRKRLRGASEAIDKLTKELNSLKAEKAFSKMTDAKCH